MRFVINKYDDGDESIVETTDDGGREIKRLGGFRKIGARVSVYVDVTSEETEESADRLLDALAWLKQEVEARKRTFAEKREKNEAKKAAKRAHKTASR
jgi:hypothetical protein